MTADGPENEQPLFLHQVTGGKRKRRGSGGMMIVAGVVALGLGGIGTVALLSFADNPIERKVIGVASLTAAKRCLGEHDLTCAEADYRAYIAKYPNDANATAILAITLTQDGHHEEAIPYYKKAAALGVDTYDFDANYATSLENTGDTDGAIKMNYAALKIVPSLVDVRGSLANELVSKGRTDEALDLLETFDRSLTDRGEAPYFTAQIERIRSKAGRPSTDQGSPATPAGGQVASNAAPAGPGGDLIALEADHGALYVPVLIDNAITLKFVVDSGATDVVIPSDVARNLMQMGQLTRSDFLGNGWAILADGSRVPSRVYNIRSLKIGSHELKNVTASVTNGRGVALLGQSFLRRFKSWSIDNRRRVLVLQE
jgi:clan AA aspartic protease (TIGR02281 family)